ncbi:MAG: hypothetical protein JW953_09420 [Anaerolineae bacterium]|nr:hypothetical protein [Anaerolineae bacterium]
MKAKLFLYVILLLLALTIQPRLISAQDFPRVCLEDPANIMPNCKFDNGLDGWQTFTENGTADFSVLQGGGECHAPLCPAAYIVTESHFVGGIYQQVSVVAGNTYYANINWLVFDSLVNDASINNAVGGGIGRRLGIDPSGGTDSRSPNIIWGPDNWRSDCKTCEAEYVVATAQADTITVFVRIEDTWRLRAAEKGYSVPPGKKDQFWLDEIGLKQVEGDAIALTNPTEPPPTDTPAPPPTDTPPAEPPTNTPVPATNTPAPPAETPAQIAQAESGPEAQPVSPLPTLTAANAAAAPPPTLTPTVPPLPTNTPSSERPIPTPTRYHRSTPTPAAASIAPLELVGVAGTTICAGGVILVIIAAVIAGLVWLYRLGWGNIDDYESGQDFDDDDEIVVEIVEDED